MIEPDGKKPVPGAPELAVNLHLYWVGHPDEQENGYPEGSPGYRLLFDPRMAKVWPKLRQGIKADLLIDGSPEYAINNLFREMLWEISAAGRERPSRYEIARTGKRIAAEVAELLALMHSINFGQPGDRAVLRDIAFRASTEALAAGPKSGLDEELIEAHRGIENAGHLASDMGERDARFVIAESARSLRDTDPRFTASRAQRTETSQSGRKRDFVLAIYHKLFPWAYAKFPDRGAVAALANVALDVSICSPLTATNIRNILKPRGNRT